MSDSLSARLLVAALVSSLAIASVTFAQGTDASPTPVESDFWRSAERINTVDSYQAYLDAFPRGFYTKLAAAAIARLQPSPLTPAAAPAGSPSTPSAPVRKGLPPELLGKLVADDRSGAVTFSVGDTFLGPGVLTIGWLGWKKQIVLPNGEWVLLAAHDHTGTPTQASTLAFGQFDSRGLRSLLYFTTNTRARSNTTNWPDFAQCEAAEASPVITQKGTLSTNRYCGRAFTAPGRAGDRTTRGTTSDFVRRNLGRIQQTPGADAPIRTDLYVLSNLWDFLAIMRYDFASERLGNGLPSQSPHASWMAAYLPLAVQGFSKSLRFDDLRPGDSITRLGISLPD